MAAQEISMPANWFRMYSETISDPKLMGVAAKANVPAGNVVAIWTTILCSAAENAVKPGFYKLTASQISCVTGYDLAMVEDIIGHLEQGKYPLLDGKRICNWAKRQKKSDSSYERVKRFREKHEGTPQPSFQKIEQKQQLDTVVTLQHSNSPKHIPNPKYPEVAAAQEFGMRMLRKWQLDGDQRIGLTSALAPAFRAGIPEEFIQDVIESTWRQFDADNKPLPPFNYLIKAIMNRWTDINRNEGTTQNAAPNRESRTSGENIGLRRSTLFDAFGSADDLDTRRARTG